MVENNVPGSGAVSGEADLKGHGRRSVWRYVIILGSVLIVLVPAAIYLRDYIERLDPNYYDRHQRAGMFYFNKGLYDIAVEEFSKAARAQPESAEAHHGLGMSYMRQSKLEKAVESFSTAIQLAPERTEFHYSLGVAYQRSGRYEDALEEYHKIAKQEPASYQVFNNVGIIHMKLGDYEKAVLALKHAIELKPDYYPPYFNLAKTYEEQGKPELAVKEYQFIRDSAVTHKEMENYVREAEQRLAELKHPPGAGNKIAPDKK